MGQCATLYRIAKADFSKLANDPEDFELLRIAKGYTTFEKSFEGLRFILSKDRDKETTELVDQIFYPKSMIGEWIGNSDIDFDNLPDDFDFEKESISYNDPENVAAIASFLDTISVEEFRDLFDYKELNENDVYPGDVWNAEISKDRVYNERHMTEEFISLKEVFATAKGNGEYLLSFVG